MIMSTTEERLSIRERVLAVLNGKKPDRLPFVGRLELWRKGLIHTGSLPQAFQDLPLTEIHRRVGMGRQVFLSPYSIRLRGVEVISHFNGEFRHQELDPVVERFPDMDHLAPPNQAGLTRTEMITPVGRLTIEHLAVEATLATGARAYMSKHPISTDEDYAVVEYIVERMEHVPQVERLRKVEAEVGEWGYVAPSLMRIPFQQLLIDYFSTENFFFALHDTPAAVQRLLDLLDERCTEFIQHLAALDAPYVQLGDNLDGMMTNPRLFRSYALPTYQRYTEMLHQQGKKVGSHTDGNIKPLFGLLKESGLDLCESISPAPLTPFTFAEIWEAWRDGPIIWGGIPSPLLEAMTSEAEFEQAIEELLVTVDNGRIILGVTDMVLPINQVERVHRIAQKVEEHRL
jgi:hypothetical protein